MQKYKRNQVQDAIFRTMGAERARADEIRFRLKRLLATDRSLGCRRQSQDKAVVNMLSMGQSPAELGRTLCTPPTKHLLYWPRLRY